MQARVVDRDLVETARQTRLAPGTSCSLRFELVSTDAHFTRLVGSHGPFGKSVQAPLFLLEIYLRHGAPSGISSPSLSLPSSSPSIPPLSLTSAHCPAQSTATQRYLIHRLTLSLGSSPITTLVQTRVITPRHRTNSAQLPLAFVLVYIRKLARDIRVTIFGIRRETMG